MSALETIIRQLDVNRFGHFRDCTLITPDVCTCDVRYVDASPKAKKRGAPSREFAVGGTL